MKKGWNAMEDYSPFVANIVKTLEKNGYPGKRVALPLERMYEVAYDKGLNFNKALTLLDERGVAHEKTTEKVVFFPKPAAAPFAGIDPTMFAGGDMQEMLAKAGELLKGMPPEQLQEIEELYRNMNDEQKEEMLKKAREMGLGF
jgi:hypothetical protein